MVGAGWLVYHPDSNQSSMPAMILMPVEHPHTLHMQCMFHCILQIQLQTSKIKKFLITKFLKNKFLITKFPLSKFLIDKVPNVTKFLMVKSS
jgi:hypothetical protein